MYSVRQHALEDYIPVLIEDNIYYVIKHAKKKNIPVTAYRLNQKYKLHKTFSDPWQAYHL